MTFDEIATTTEEKIEATYWAACDARQAAIDPAEITTSKWMIEILAESYEIALRIEADPMGWQEGRSKW